MQLLYAVASAVLRLIVELFITWENHDISGNKADRSSWSATAPKKTPAGSSAPAQETTTAGSESVVAEVGTPAVRPPGPRWRPCCRPCSNRQPQLF